MLIFVLDPDWMLIFTTRTRIFSLSGSGDDFLSLEQPKNIMHENAASIQFITSDERSKDIYWTDASYVQKGVYKMSLKKATSKLQFVDSGLYFPNGIAFDWVTGNVYLIDSKMGIIVICGNNVTKCATIVQETTYHSDLIDIALHPNHG